MIVRRLIEQQWKIVGRLCKRGGAIGRLCSERKIGKLKKRATASHIEPHERKIVKKWGRL